MRHGTQSGKFRHGIYLGGCKSYNVVMAGSLANGEDGHYIVSFGVKQLKRVGKIPDSKQVCVCWTVPVLL